MSIITKTGLVRPTLQELVNDINGALQTRLNTLQGSLAKKALYTLAKLFAPALALALAGVLWSLWDKVEYAADQAFVQHAADVNLDLWADRYGLTRIAALYAIGYATITGTVGETLAAGSVLTRGDGWRYETDASATIGGGGTIDAAITAIDAGADGNCDAGTVLELEYPVSGIDTAATVYSGGCTGGADVESDDDLRERIMDYIATPLQGGSEADYEAWAKASASSCAKVWVRPIEDGPGTVTVYVLPAGTPPESGQTRDSAELQGAAHDVAITAVDGAGKGYIKVDKTDLADRLGYTPLEGDFATGRVYFFRNGEASSRYVDIDGAGLVSDSSDWKVTFDEALTANPDVLESVALICAELCDAQDYIDQRYPCTDLPKVKMPVGLRSTLDITINPDSSDTEDAASAELITYFDEIMSPGATIYNSQISVALGRVTTITNHIINDVDGNGSTADISPADNEVVWIDTTAISYT